MQDGRWWVGIYISASYNGALKPMFQLQGAEQNLMQIRVYRFVMKRAI